MKILHISTFKNGGAGTAAFRLHLQLVKEGHKSDFLFLEKGQEADTIFKYSNKVYIFELFFRILKKIGLPPNLEQSNDYKIRKYKRKFEWFSFANTPYKKLTQHKLLQECDVVHLHFVANFIDYDSFFKMVKKPIVWTLHDMNPFQGGFHYKNDERKYAAKLNGLDEQQYTLKKTALGALTQEELSVVAPSKWLLRKSLQAELLGRFAHYHIPNGINTKVFKPRDRLSSIAQLNLPIDKPIALFVAESLKSHRKGFDRITELTKDPSLTEKYNFVAVGNSKQEERVNWINYLGSVQDEVQMSIIYNAATVFILPSREDNLPNTMIESLCCGTPVVAFPVGGIMETITNGKNGFLSSDHTVDGLKKALNSCMELRKSIDREAIAMSACAVFDVAVQAESYIKLYRGKLNPQTKVNLKMPSEIH